MPKAQQPVGALTVSDLALVVAWLRQQFPAEMAPGLDGVDLSPTDLADRLHQMAKAVGEEADREVVGWGRPS